MSENINNESIDGFCSLTNTSFEEAKSYLTATDGDLELALCLFFENDTPQSSRPTFPSYNNENNITTIEETTTPQGTTNATTITTIDDENTITTTVNTTTTTSGSTTVLIDDDDSMDLDNEDDEEITKISQIDADEELAKMLYEQEEKEAAVRAPIPPRRDILFGSGIGGGSYSIRDQNARRLREQQHRTFAGDIRPHHVANKQPDKLLKLYSPPFDIMSTENFEMTRNRAKSTGKWIMINIQSIGEFSSQVLNRDLWSNETVKDIIRAHFCFLQYNSDSADGSKYINFYPVYKYPHVSVIDPRTGERLKVWDSQLAPTEFIIKVTDFLAKYSLDEEPNHSESSSPKKTSDGTSEMSVDDQSKAEPQISSDTDNVTNNNNIKEEKEEKEVPKVHPVFEEIPYKSIFDSIKPIERPDQTGPKSTSIKFRLEGRHVIKKFNKKDPVRYMFEYLKASVPELQDKFFELNYLRSNLIEKIDETIEEAELISAAINVVLG